MPKRDKNISVDRSDGIFQATSQEVSPSVFHEKHVYDSGQAGVGSQISISDVINNFDSGLRSVKYINIQDGKIAVYSTLSGSDCVPISETNIMIEFPQATEKRVREALNKALSGPVISEETMNKIQNLRAVIADCAVNGDFAKGLPVAKINKSEEARIAKAAERL
jgi:hypothetical protein